MAKIQERINVLRQARADAEAVFNKALVEEAKKDKPEDPVN